MLPVALIAPVGATVVPPLILNVPSEVRAPEPEYVPDGVMEIFPELVVV
jgi:hypothetical protein